MDTEEIKQLVNKYEQGETTREEEQKLREFFRNHPVSGELEPYAKLFEYYDAMAKKRTSSTFNPLGKVEVEGEVINQSVNDRKKAVGSSVVKWTLRLAAGIALLLVGFAAGQFLEKNQYASSEQVAELQNEVEQMKSALMYTGGYQMTSAGERLSAVNLSTQMPVNDNQKLDEQITDILIYSMNNDKSVNVRMAAAEALFRFRNQPRIKKAFVNALNQQDDPFMQITIIDMLVELKAEGAINEMQKMLVNSDTQDIVRERLEAGIAELQV